MSLTDHLEITCKTPAEAINAIVNLTQEQYHSMDNGTEVCFKRGDYKTSFHINNENDYLSMVTYLYKVVSDYVTPTYIKWFGGEHWEDIDHLSYDTTVTNTHYIYGDIADDVIDALKEIRNMPMFFGLSIGETTVRINHSRLLGDISSDNT